MAAQLSDYTVDHPNPAGSGLALLVGFGAGSPSSGGQLGVQGLFLPVLRDAFRPLAWVARSLLGQWEPRQAKFVGTVAGPCQGDFRPWGRESPAKGPVLPSGLFSLGSGRCGRARTFPGRQPPANPAGISHRGHSHAFRPLWARAPKNLAVSPLFPGAGAGTPDYLYKLLPHRVAAAAGFLCGAVRPLPFGDGGLSAGDGCCRAGSLPLTGLSFASNHFLRS